MWIPLYVKAHCLDVKLLSQDPIVAASFESHEQDLFSVPEAINSEFTISLISYTHSAFSVDDGNDMYYIIILKVDE